MVLDGADDQAMFHKNRATSKPDGSGKQKRKTLLDYVPKSNGLVLITSRSHQLASSMVGQEADGEIEIPPLTTEESLSLLRKTLSEDLCDDEGALALVEALHRSPTAINQATAYILTRDTQMSISDYLAALKSQTLQISDEDGIAVKASEINSPESAAVAAWQILYEFIRQKHHESAQLLAIISVLELQRIPVPLLNMTSKDKKQVKAAISILVQFGMITFFTSQKYISATRLVQLCTKAWLTQRNEKAGAEDRALWLVKKAFPVPENEEYDTCDQTCDQLHPYANVVLKFQPTSIESKLNLATLLFNTAGYSKYLGKYDDARRSLEDALKLREENLGKDDEQVQEIKKALEALSEAQNQNGAGSQLTKDGASASTGKKGSIRATDLVRNTKWPRALTKVQSLLQLAQQSLDQEHHQEAEAHSKEGLAECEKTLGQDHIDTLKMADCLAIAYQSQGRGDEALASHIRVLDWCRATYGPSHIDTLRQTYNLALTYDLQGQFDSAIPLYEEALEGIKALVGPDSPEVLRILCSLATIYDILGDSATAEPLFQTALTGQQQALGPEHPETLLTMHNLALLAQSRNDLATAETYLLHVLSGQEQILGPEHSATLRTASNLALNFQLQRKYEQAEPLFNLTLEGQRARLGEEHPDTLCTRFMLGDFLEEVGRMGEAQVQFKLALEGREKRLGEGHPDTVMARRKLESLGEGLEVVRGPESVAA
jgi:tetratricopeptide (TPR) repeat protein